MKLIIRGSLRYRSPYLSVPLVFKTRLSASLIKLPYCCPVRVRTSNSASKMLRDAYFTTGQFMVFNMSKNDFLFELLAGIEPTLTLITSEVHHHLCVRSILFVGDKKTRIFRTRVVIYYILFSLEFNNIFFTGFMGMWLFSVNIKDKPT